MIVHGISRTGVPFWGRLSWHDDEHAYFSSGWVGDLANTRTVMGNFYCATGCIVGLQEPEDIPERWFWPEDSHDEELEELP